MKTIAISETAYDRLEGWKTSPTDTFSNVIERIVPRKVTFEVALEAAQQLPELSSAQEKELLKFYKKNRQPMGSPWK